MEHQNNVFSSTVTKGWFKILSQLQPVMTKKSMLNHPIFKTTLLIFGLSLSTASLADEANIHVSGGISLSDMGSNQTVTLIPDGYTVFYNTSSETTLSPFLGLGFGYQWDHLLKNRPVALNLGITGYYVNNPISGTDYPGGTTAFDPVGYTGSDNTLAWMLEPKFIYTAYSWQPYFIAGIGIATNTLSGFTEQQISGSENTPGNTIFANKTNTNLAYEFGMGLQHALYDTKSGGNLVIGIEYRYMNFGLMGFGSAPLQTTTQGLTLGDLETNMINATLSYQF